MKEVGLPYNSFKFITKKISSHVIHVTVQVPPTFVRHVTNHIAEGYRNSPHHFHFHKGLLPLDYTHEYYKKEIERDTERFIFKHCVTDYLFAQIEHHKIMVTNWPRFTAVEKTDDGKLSYVFSCSVAQALPISSWRESYFACPARKNYKDLDKQVDLFLETHRDDEQEHETIQVGDWICFKATPLTDKKRSVFSQTPRPYWIRVMSAETGGLFHENFIGKHIGHSWETDFSPTHGSDGPEKDEGRFRLIVESITPGLSFSSDRFREHFNIESDKNLPDKLIEVFSFRHDISLRKTIVDELFQMFMHTYRFEVPAHTITRRTELILRRLKNHPDQNVYTSNKEFSRHATLLAEQEIKEEILIDQIAAAESITPSERDIENYLSLFNNARTREFVYFHPLVGELDELHIPIQQSLIRQTVRREKTLNYVIDSLCQ